MKKFLVGYLMFLLMLTGDMNARCGSAVCSRREMRVRFEGGNLSRTHFHENPRRKNTAPYTAV